LQRLEVRRVKKCEFELIAMDVIIELKEGGRKDDPPVRIIN
jgi:hypothetical protein